MTLDLSLIEHPQVHNAPLPIATSKNSSTAIGYF
jgi:hypothetical protein